MRRRTLPYLLIAPLLTAFISGCSTDDAIDSSSYDEMTSKYTLLTVSGLWSALDDGTVDYNGSYILLKGVLKSVGTDSAILMDTSTSKAVTCTFNGGIDLTDLSNVLDNDIDSSDENTITIGGVCHYYTDTSSYPCIESCDYYYINSDA